MRIGEIHIVLNCFPKIRENESKRDPNDDAENEDDIIPIYSQSTDLGKAVPSWESVEMVHQAVFDSELK